MSWPRTWLLLLLLFSGSGQAELRLVLDGAELSQAERQASQALLQEALEALPGLFKQRLERRVRVRWRQLPAEVYGRAGRFSGIELNARLLPALSDGSAALQPSGRVHGTVRRELLATLLHELTHLYDRARLWSPATKVQLSACRRQLASRGPVGLADACRGQTARRFSLSDDPLLLDLAGWPQRVGRRGQRETRNAQAARSPDSYELSNPREFVAVNLEYFLLDPSYACRRPSL
ncbi:MAG TPA: hypothetical protein VFY62_15845, partial [Pseudomonas sp.]|nr:hypothetical protein [Pseudomonas sp.]